MTDCQNKAGTPASRCECCQRIEQGEKSSSFYRKVQEHPCFSEKAAHCLGRIHLPVAPKCNIQCNYCIRQFDCVNETRPGVTSRVITPQEALQRVTEVIEKFPNIKVAGIAGPGDPLFNDETLETFRLIGERFPDLHKCMSTNGLLLPEKLDSLKALGVDTLTVTLNAIDPAIAEKVYSFVIFHGKKLEGREAVEVLLAHQLSGIELAVKNGMLVKINTVMIPGVNDTHIIEIAKKIKELGVFMQNIIPLIPLNRFASISPPSDEDVKKMRETCAKVMKQMMHCRQCRSDAVGLLHQDMSTKLFSQLGCSKLCD